jgi:uncharacterized protein (DUF1697 family)
MSQYVALLRGINVGGKNIIKMADLRACFEAEGYDDVVTYIQSGNVIFRAAGARRAQLTRRMENILASTFNYQASVVLRSRSQLSNVITRAPAEFGKRPEQYRYDAVFLKEPLTAKTAMKSVLAKSGVDRVHTGPGVLYFSRLISKASQSWLSRLVQQPVYRNMTIRNWNTTTKVLQLMNEMES